MARQSTRKQKPSNGANIGFEATLWAAADKLRNHMDAAEYKHVVLGLIFLKYISDAFEERRVSLETELGNPKSEWYVAEPQARYQTLEDRDEYQAANVFWVPKVARWSTLQANAKQPSIGKQIDEAMVAIERDNPSLKGVLPKDYARPALDKTRLGELIDLIGTIGLGDRENRSKDILGRVYEYFLSQFASAEGKQAGQFYTPRCVVRTLVEMIEPFKGRVFDPCCGSGGMFVQSERFMEAHGGRIGDLSIYGQESNPTTWRLCRMNLAIRGIEANVQWNNEGSFLNDAHKDLKADFILANPPFNQEDWGYSKVKGDIRWKYGEPPAGGRRKQKDGSTIYVDGGYANYAWVQHFIHHLAPHGTAGFVLAKGSLHSEKSGEGAIRKKIISDDLVDCIVTLPNQLFYNTPIPSCLWFITKNKGNYKGNRKGRVLFINARNLGYPVDKRHIEFSDSDIEKIVSIYHSWQNNANYRDIPGLCKSVTNEQILNHGGILTPSHYIDPIEDLTEELNFPQKVKFINNKLYLWHEKLKEKEYLLISNEIFKHWFIDFEFPNNQGKPYKSNGGQMVASDFGEIPIGWKIEPITHIADVIDCLHAEKPEQVEDGPILLQVYNIGQDGTIDLTEKYSVSNEDYQKWIKNIEVTEGDCVISNVGRVGAIARIPSSLKAGIGRNMTAIRAKTVSSAYLLGYLLSKYGKKEITVNTDEGTILNSLNVRGIKKIKVLIPDDQCLEKFARLNTWLLKNMATTHKNTLDLYSTFTPKLLTGEICDKIVD
jgi:Type I restriction-modification system methyltransferase subunit